MKKLMFVAAAALAGSLFAETAIESANIVGYVSKELQPNTWYLVGNGFAPVSGSGNMSIQDMIKGLTPTDDVGTAPMIQYWNGIELKTAVYLTSTWEETADDYFEYEESWGSNDDGSIVRKDFAPGEACWLLIKGDEAQTASFAGAVQNANDLDVTLTTDWQFVGNPFPVAYSLFDGVGYAGEDAPAPVHMDCSGLTPTDDAGTAPMIQYWDETELKTVIYWESTWEETADDYFEYGPSWGSPDDGSISRVEFEPCQGYWACVRSGTGTIKFIK